jgi:xanthine/CO dehydrogenase XdhC/CoxF family maturation factor
LQSSESTILEHSFLLNSTHSAFLTINSTNPFVSALSNEDADQVLNQHQSKVKVLENELLFVEFLPVIPRIVLYGNLFDSSSLIELCHFLSWDVCWVGNPLKMNASLKNKVQSYFHWDDEFVLKNNDVIVLMTHDFDRDVAIIKHLISINFKGYVGILGPLKRMQKIIKQLEILSVKMKDMSFFGPIGLDIGAEGPNEIALSIVSEIIAFNSSRDGSSLRNRTKSIHTN